MNDPSPRASPARTRASAARAGSRSAELSLRIARVPITHPDAMLLVEEVQAEYVLRYGGRDDTPLDGAEFDEPKGSFWLGYLADEPVVSGAWRFREVPGDVEGSRAAEVKRMYVRPAHQRRGLARAMLAHLERTAREAGADVMVLETGSKQPEAIAMYASSGYSPIAGFGHYADSPGNRCFAKPLN